MNAARVLTDDTVGTVQLGDRWVRRMGYGAMRVSGARNADGVRDRLTGVALVQRLRELGVQFFDAANVYGFGQCEQILGEALAPYRDDVLVATKAGFEPGKVAPGASSLPPQGRPEHVREECDKSLKRLGVDVIELYQVHVPDPSVPYEETVGAFAELQRVGKIRHIGISNVTVAQLRQAQSMCDVVSVQNSYGLGNNGSEAVLQVCAQEGITFMPHSANHLSEAASAVVEQVAAAHGASFQQISTAWVLGRAPVVLAIPGTSQVRHAEENVEAAWLQLSAYDIQRLDAVHWGEAG